MTPRPATLIVARRLDQMHSGSSVYLRGYLELCRKAGLRTRLILAPRRTFGNRPWMRIHPGFEALVEDIDWPQTVRLGRYWLSLSPAVWFRFGKRCAIEVWRWACRATDVPYPSRLGFELSSKEAGEVVGRARKHGASVVTVEYSSLAPLLGKIEAKRRVVLLHDLFSLRAADFLERGVPPDHAAPTLEEEARRCQSADLLVHASCIERDALAPLLPHASHIWMAPEFRHRRVASDGAEQPHGIFIGSLHAGNVAALTFLRREVWPRVRAAIPEAELWLVGAISTRVTPSEARDEGLRLFGRVDDLEGFGGPQAVGLAPLKAGSGIPIKVVDYLSLRLPVVVSDEGIAAFGQALDGIVLEEPTDAAYVRAVCRLLSDDSLRKSMSRETSRVAERLSNEGLVSELLS